MPDTQPKKKEEYLADMNMIRPALRQRTRKRRETKYESSGKSLKGVRVRSIPAQPGRVDSPS